MTTYWTKEKMQCFFKENAHMKPSDPVTNWKSMKVIKQAPNTHKNMWDRNVSGIYQNQKQLDEAT